MVIQNEPNQIKDNLPTCLFFIMQFSNFPDYVVSQLTVLTYCRTSPTWGGNEQGLFRLLFASQPNVCPALPCTAILQLISLLPFSLF